MFLADFAARARPDASPTLDSTAAVSAFLDEVWRHPKVRLWGLPHQPPEVPPEISTHQEGYRFAIEAPYRVLAAQSGKKRWGDKTPSYLEHVDGLIEIWPDARFLLLVRDGRDVALSIRKLPFGANNVLAAARDWSRGIRIGLAASSRYPEKFLTVLYEDLVAEPESQVKRICQFLSLSFVPSMLEVESTDRAVLENDKVAWFGKLWGGINQSSAGRWRHEMSDRDQALFVALAHAELLAYRYELGTDRKEMPSRVKVGIYRIDDLARRIVNFVRLRIVQERGREVRYVLRRKLNLT